MAAIDAGGAIVHEVGQYIVLKPVMPDVRGVESPHFQSGQGLLIIGRKGAEIKENIAALQAEMMEAAQNLQFERAAELRDKIKQLEERING